MSITKHTFVLSIGSNTGDKIKNVENAVKWLAKLLDSTTSSNIYETPEIHGKYATYMNAVVSGETDLEYEDVLRLTKEFEIENGRTKEGRERGFVPIDIDIVIYDENVVRPLDFVKSFFQIGFNLIRKV